VIVAEGVSKRYPSEPVRMFPPIVSMFHRNWFTLRRSEGVEEPEEVEAKSASRHEARAARSRAAARQREQFELDDLDDADDDDDDDDDDEDDDDELGPTRLGGPTPDEPGEMFWALKDVSFSVPPGAALGVLGGQGAGKSTLLNIIGGRAFPTEGRVLTRGVVSPMPSGLAKAIALTGKGYFNFDLVLGCRLVGIEPHLVKRHREEIEELAQPVLGPDGEPAPGALVRLAVATAAILPASAILFEDGLRGMDEAFTNRVVERLRDRLRSGTSLVFASQEPQPMAELCDEVIVLDGGSIVGRGDSKRAIAGYEPAQNGGGGTAPKRARRASSAIVPGSPELGERELRVPAVQAAFNSSAALISAEVQRADGSPSKRIHTADELSVVIRLETIVPDTEVHCGVCFTPRSGETGVRVHPPEPLRLRDPRAYVVVVRVPAGTLPGGGYKVHASAVVASAAEREASAITRDAGRLRIVGDDEPAQAPAVPADEHWDGCVSWRADGEWSIE
jgi:ABC-type polysaccharide/polyol phosphate transport system ATPase subunit